MASVAGHEVVRAGGSGEHPSLRGRAVWAATAVAAAAAFWPLLADFGLRVWRSEHYRYVLVLVPFLVAWGVRRYRATEPSAFDTPKPIPRLAGWSVVLAVAAAGVLLFSPFAAAVALLAGVLAALYERGGRGLVVRMLPVWCVLWLAVPLPFGWDQYLIRSLQRVATDWASGVLDLGGIRHLPDGVVIRIPERDFFVDEACSGVHSLFASLAFTAVLMAASGRGLFVAAFMVASAVGWVLLGNVIRVCSVVVLAGRYDLPVVEGLGHELLGVVVFALVVGLILSTDRLTRFAFPGRAGIISRLIAAWRRRAAAAKPAEAATSGAVPARRRGAVLVPVILTGAFAGLAAVGWSHPHRRALASLSKDLEQFKPVRRETLPDDLDGWRQGGFEVRRREVNDPAGMLSRIWTYRKGRLVAAVSVDGPYAQWHDLADCYRGLGFSVLSQRDAAIDEPDGAAAGYTELHLQNDRGRHGLVLFMAYTESDRPVAPRGGDPISRRLGTGLMGWSGEAAGSGGELVYDVQLLAESGLTFTAGEQADLRRLFHEARQIIAKGATAAGPTPQRGAEGGIAP